MKSVSRLSNLMMFKNFCYVLFLFTGCFLMNGCTAALTHSQIKELKSGVNINDGVNKHEAVIVAQNFIIENQLWDRLSTLKPYRIKERTVWFHKGESIVYAIAPIDRKGVTIEQVWILYFRDKRNSVFRGFMPITPFRVVVDAQTAKIISFGLDKLGDKDDLDRTRTYSKQKQL